MITSSRYNRSHDPCVYLNNGDDSASLDYESISLCSKGLTLTTPWNFPLGTCLHIKVDQTNTTSPLYREGIVVHCECCEESTHRFRTTLLFLNDC